MSISSVFTAFALLPLLIATADAESKQKLAETLMDQTAEFSSLRTAGAPSFRMKASFRVLNNASTFQGTYSETWASRDQWRREIELGGFHRIEVGTRSKKWSLETGKDTSTGVNTVAFLLNRVVAPDDLKATAVVHRDVGGVAALCVEGETEKSKELYCADPKDSTLLLHESSYPQIPSAYVYRDYVKFGNWLVPRSAKVTGLGGDIEITVSELVPEPSPDPSQFVPLPGTVAVPNCTDMTPPRVESASGPTFPQGEHATSAQVVLQAIVGTDGRLHDIKVGTSGGAAFDEEAMRAAARWRFKPGTCGGELLPVHINIPVEFRR